MTVLENLQQHLGWKLFLSYLLVLVIGIVVLDTVAGTQARGALTRNVPQLLTLEKTNPGLLSSVEANFQASVDQFLIVATVAGVLAAVAASLFSTRRILGPIQSMQRASQRIAQGDYHVRIKVANRDELGALAQSLNQMAKALDSTEHRRMELIGEVAHELRTPLSSVKSSLEGIVDGVIPLDPDSLLSLEREVSRMQRLVSDLEELSKAEAGQIRLEIVLLNIGDLITKVTERLGSQFEDKGVTLQVELSPNLPTALADPNRITQVLINLLGNALQYTPPGGQVSVHTICQRAELLVEIKDTGIGITADQLPHIFERFYRVDKSRSRVGGGSGIGLTISKYLVEAQNGRIWASSDGLDRGSTFAFTLPFAR